MRLTTKAHSLATTTIFSLLVIGLTFARPAVAQSSIDLAVHYVEGIPAEDKIAYQMKVFLSVLDSAGNPLKDLTNENFTVAEDSQQVEIESLSLASDEPIHIALVLDTSGSMGGPAMEAARKAASSFVSGLQAEDQVALLTFDNTVKTVLNFTTDHTAARAEIQLLQAVSGAGTCLYDAAYQAAQLTATLPAGRRAVVLFTDGVDETSKGGVCSTNTPDDVIRLASEGGTRVPVYALTLGNRADTKVMERFALQTGGRSLHSSDAGQLEAVFLRLADQLRSQYILRYTSEAGPGAHTLAVAAQALNAQDNDTRNFLLPNFPTRIFFSTPAEGQEVNGVVLLKVDVFGQGQPLQQVLFEAKGETLGSDSATPYELEADLSEFGSGDLTIDAIAKGPDGIEVARASLTVKVASAEATATPTEPASLDGDNLALTIGLGVGGLLLLAGGIAVFLILRRRRAERLRDEEWRKATEGSPDDVLVPAAGFDRTVDSWEISPDALGMLIVTGSDDATLIGQRFELTRSKTTLGRSADNDINFPKDSPVSRRHAVIEEKKGGLFLQQVEATDSSGQAKLPTYGTFINEIAMEEDPVLLQTGDEIRLGKRVRLKFEAGSRVSGGEELTYDGLEDIPDDYDSDKTRDQ